MVGHKLGEFAPYASPYTKVFPLTHQIQQSATDMTSAGQGKTSHTSRPRTNKHWVVCAPHGRLGIACIYLDVLLLVKNEQLFI